MTDEPIVSSDVTQNAALNFFICGGMAALFFSIAVLIHGCAATPGQKLKKTLGGIVKNADVKEAAAK